MTGCGRKLGPYDCCTVIQGDCLELMKALPSGCVDAVITDPPYGVGLSYANHDDGREGYRHFVGSAFLQMRRISNFIAITPGIRNLWLYPEANWVVCWAKPNSMGRSDMGGFNQWEPICIYGKHKMYHDFFYLPMCGQPDTGNHPCPKPYELLHWLIRKATDEGVTILDPFLGSGTTAVAAKKLGRHFLGFEISETYCQIARERIALVDMQPSLFQPQPEQAKIFT